MLKVEVICFVSLVLCYCLISTAEAGIFDRIRRKTSRNSAAATEVEPRILEEDSDILPHYRRRESDEELTRDAAYWASYPGTSYGRFDLRQGKADVIAVLKEIEEYLPTAVDVEDVNNAQDLEDLISAANNSLTTNQDNQLGKLNSNDRATVFWIVSEFMGKFGDALKESGHGDKIVPLSYLYTKLKNANNNNQHNDEDSLAGLSDIHFSNLPSYGMSMSSYYGDSNTGYGGY